MLCIPDEASQLAPSQFAYFKPVQHSATASGITPGQAPLDTPPPNRSPSPFLERSQRTRKPTARKLEGDAGQAQPSRSSKKQNLPATSKRNGKNIRKAGNPSTSKSTLAIAFEAIGSRVATQSGAVGDSAEGQGGFNIQGAANEYEDEGKSDEEEDKDETVFVNPTIIKQLESLLGHSVEHLSDRQIKDLLDKVFETQAFTVGAQIEPAAALTQSLAGVGLASGDRSGSNLFEKSGQKLLPQGSKTNGGHKGLVSLQKRRLDAPTAGHTSKHARTGAEKDDTSTDSESESESDSESDSNSKNASDSDSEPEVTPPISHNPFKSSKPTSTTPRSKPTPAGQDPTTFTRPLTLASARPLASTSATTVHTHYPSLPDLNNNEALVNWALKVIEQRAPGSNLSFTSSTPGPSGSQRPSLPTATTTTTHVTQAIATHWAERTAAEEPETQATTGTVNTDTLTPASALHSGGGKKKYHRKTKLGDFPGRIGEIASAAIPYFLATACAEGSYETPETFQDWVLDTYYRKWVLEYPEQSDKYEPPPVAVLKIMTRRASWLRGEVKKRIRPIVQYGYGFHHPAVSRTHIKHNRRLAKKLKPNVFHCKNLRADTNQFEHNVFVLAIGAGLFWDPESLGAVFEDRFKPVPLPAVALILTMMQACIEEWLSGHYKTVELDLDTQKKVFERHLLGLYAYERGAAARLARFCGNWATSGMAYSGAALHEDPTAVKPYVLASNVRPDTPPLEHTSDNET